MATGSLPLRYRLPNAPPLFVGREDEASELRAMFERAPVCLVFGLGGLGKTSLVLHTLHAFFPEQVKRTLMIGLRPGDRLEVEVMRAVAAAGGLGKVDYGGLLADPDALLAALIDHTEVHDMWILLDDLHHADAGSARDVLDKLARYARTTRWIATSRVDPQLPELAGQILTLRPMTPDDLYELASRYAPGLGSFELERAITASAGSPWQLRQLLAGGEARPRLSDDLLQDVPRSAGRLLETLAVLELPLGPRTLEPLAPLPSADELRGLEQRGLLERRASGLRLHDLARAAIAEQVDLRSRSVEIARALSTAHDPLAQLEAVRIFLGLGQLEEAASLLDTCCDALVGAGLSPRLHQLLSPLGHPRFDRHRLRCAVDLGTPSALEAARLPKEPTLPDRFLWALAQFARGRIAETVPIAFEVRHAALAAPPTPESASIALEAGIIEAACLGEQGYAERALATLEALKPLGPEATALWLVNRSRWLIHADHADKALSELEQLHELDIGSHSPIPRELRGELIVALAMLGRIRTLEQTLSALSLEAPAGSADLFGFRRGLLSETLLELYRGRFDKGGALLRSIAPLMRQTSYLRSFLHALAVERRLWAGELTDLEGLIEALFAEAARSGHALNACWAEVDAIRLAQLRGRARIEPQVEAPRRTRFWESMATLYKRRHALRHGLELPPRGPLGSELVHGRLMEAIFFAEEQILIGNPDTARVHAATAHAVASEHGYAPGALEALVVICEAELVAGDDEELARAASELLEKAHATSSPRFVGEAQFFAAAAEQRLSAAELAELAELEQTAPVAARRARALLGREAPLDRLDMAILDKLQRRLYPGRKNRSPDAEAAPFSWQERPGWSLDKAEMVVWLPGDRRVDLASKRLLFRILSTLAEHGGKASKEALVLGAWELRDYHPMRDDKRLQVAIRKLRLLIEDDPSRASRLVTTNEGYAIGQGEPFQLHSSDDPPRSEVQEIGAYRK